MLTPSQPQVIHSPNNDSFVLDGSANTQLVRYSEHVLRVVKELNKKAGKAGERGLEGMKVAGPSKHAQRNSGNILRA
jgi:hypothetical protein